MKPALLANASPKPTLQTRYGSKVWPFLMILSAMYLLSKGTCRARWRLTVPRAPLASNSPSWTREMLVGKVPFPFRTTRSARC